MWVDVGISFTQTKNFLYSNKPDKIKEKRSMLNNSIAPIVLLVFSNVFMTFAWYGHLKYKTVALPLVVLVSWGIAFFEYCLQVPANRIGSGFYKPAELKTIQEVISLSVFLVFSVFYLGTGIKWNYVIGFALMCLGAFFVFREW